MTDGFPKPAFVVRRMSRDDYMACLKDLVLALVERHGELSVRSVHELANLAIITHGIDAAAAQIRSGR